MLFSLKNTKAYEKMKINPFIINLIIVAGIVFVLLLGGIFYNHKNSSSEHESNNNPTPTLICDTFRSNEVTIKRCIDTVTYRVCYITDRYGISCNHISTNLMNKIIKNRTER